jgi:trk system potassium uptake protein TrkA
VRVLVIGAGQVGTAVVESLHEAHDVTVVDLDTARLNALSYRYDILTVEGNGASRGVLVRAGIKGTDLVIASTDRDEVNIVAALQARSLCAGKVIARTQSAEYLDAWRQGQFDVDFMVSSEIEIAQAVARAVGMPAAVQTDVFAGGRVEMVEFALDAEHEGGLVGRTVAEAGVPDESVLASIIRGDRVIIPGGQDRFELDDRLVVIASPAAAKQWAERLSTREERGIEQVVIAGGGATGRQIASFLSNLELRVRLIEIDAQRARLCAEELPDVEVYNADASDPEFLARENIGLADAMVLCTDDDGRDLLIALLAKSLGTRMTIAVVGNPDYVPIFERSGVDLALNQRSVTAEEIVRFTHDPRTQAFAMVEHDLAEVLELEVRPESAMLGRLFRDRPLAGAIVGAIIRDGQVIFPRGDDALQAGDRAILVADTKRVAELERIL